MRVLVSFSELIEIAIFMLLKSYVVMLMIIIIFISLYNVMF